MTDVGSQSRAAAAWSPTRSSRLIVYILYLVGLYRRALPAVIGVIIAHVQVGTAEPMLASHYRFQIRTFWIGVLVPHGRRRSASGC